MKQIKKLLRRDWRYIAGIAAVFFISVFLGRILQQLHLSFLEKLGNEYYHKLERLSLMMKGQPFWVEIGMIWFNNVMASAFAIIIGLFLPLLPLGPLLANGLMIGFFQNMVTSQRKVGVFQFYLALTPHGVFELSAFFLAVLLGIRLGCIPYRLIWQHHMTRQRRPLFRIFLADLRYYWGLITLVLLVAAVMEVTVSPLLMK